ncbi:MAG: fumarylacetoacetate hydrolase family protein, partial [Gaiellaceae bacterium]
PGARSGSRCGAKVVRQRVDGRDAECVQTWAKQANRGRKCASTRAGGDASAQIELDQTARRLRHCALSRNAILHRRTLGIMNDARHAAPILIARYLANGHAHYGRLSGDAFERLSDAPWLGGAPVGRTDARDAVQLLTPTVPTKIVCVGLNYVAHIGESQSVVSGAAPPAEPLLFFKPPSAALASEQAIRYPRGVTRLDPEAEMGLVIGRRARAVSELDAMSHVAGLTAFNDVSARNYQKSDGQWARAKGFDTFAPFGPYVAVGLEPRGRRVECRVNGERRQQGNTADLLFGAAFLVHFISHVMTLEPGDVIATGTPAGIAPVEPGDVIEVEVEGVGVLRNRVELAQ